MLCVTDGIDGYLARRHGTTRSGAFLDPLADKVLVLGAMFALVKQRRVLVAAGASIIAAREIAISMYRSIAGRHGHQRPGEQAAKVRRSASSSRSGFALLPWSRLDARWLVNGFLWVAVVLALVSGAPVPVRMLAELRVRPHAP